MLFALTLSLSFSLYLSLSLYVLSLAQLLLEKSFTNCWLYFIRFNFSFVFFDAFLQLFIFFLFSHSSFHLSSWLSIFFPFFFHNIFLAPSVLSVFFLPFIVSSCVHHFLFRFEYMLVHQFYFLLYFDVALTIDICTYTQKKMKTTFNFLFVFIISCLL